MFPLERSGARRSISPEQVPGFVLQTGAMALVENANELADSLGQRNFPTFVKKSGFNHSYREYVGLHPDRQSAENIDADLAKQDFGAILKRWTPPGKPEYRSAISPR